MKKQQFIKFSIIIVLIIIVAGGYLYLVKDQQRIDLGASPETKTLVKTTYQLVDVSSGKQEELRQDYQDWLQLRSNDVVAQKKLAGQIKTLQNLVFLINEQVAGYTPEQINTEAKSLAKKINDNEIVFKDAVKRLNAQLINSDNRTPIIPI